MQSDFLPYDVLIDPSGVWYGPADTLPKSRDWQHFDDVYTFFLLIVRPEFVLNVDRWRVRGVRGDYQSID